MTGPRIQPGRVTALLRDMVDIYSPSGKEHEITAHLADTLQGTGLDVVSSEVDDGRCNLLISSGRSAPELLFLGHVDTVPAFDIEHYDFSERDGIGYGLGTADMKGGCAAMLEAFMAAAEAGCLPDHVLLALVVGEEEAGDGTQALLEQMHFGRALVAEPTGLKPCLDHFGYVEMNVRAFGSRRHAAVAGRDTNAIRALLRVLLRLEEYVDAGDPDVVLNIRDLHSSESGFAVPDRCVAGIDLHLPPGVRASDYADALGAFVHQALADSSASRHEIEFATLADGYRIGEHERLPVLLRRLFEARGMDWRPAAFASHSDANLLREAGCSPLILGPGELAKAHTRDESVPLAQVITAAGIYAALLAAESETPGQP